MQWGYNPFSGSKGTKQCTITSLPKGEVSCYHGAYQLHGGDSAMHFPIIDVRVTGQNIDRLIKTQQISVRTLQNYFGFDAPRAIYKWLCGEH